MKEEEGQPKESRSKINGLLEYQRSLVISLWNNGQLSNSELTQNMVLKGGKMLFKVHFYARS